VYLGAERSAKDIVMTTYRNGLWGPVQVLSDVVQSKNYGGGEDVQLATMRMRQAPGFAFDVGPGPSTDNLRVLYSYAAQGSPSLVHVRGLACSKTTLVCRDVPSWSTTARPGQQWSANVAVFGGFINEPYEYRASFLSQDDLTTDLVVVYAGNLSDDAPLFSPYFQPNLLVDPEVPCMTLPVGPLDFSGQYWGDYNELKYFYSDATSGQAYFLHGYTTGSGLGCPTQTAYYAQHLHVGVKVY
jgi:hypothetical protein